jgi:hypothetical protein
MMRYSTVLKKLTSAFAVVAVAVLSMTLPAMAQNKKPNILVEHFVSS